MGQACNTVTTTGSDALCNGVERSVTRPVGKGVLEQMLGGRVVTHQQGRLGQLGQTRRGQLAFDGQRVGRGASEEVLQRRALHRIDGGLHGLWRGRKTDHQPVQRAPQGHRIDVVLVEQAMRHDGAIEVRKDAPCVLEQGLHGRQATAQRLDRFALLDGVRCRGLLVDQALIVEGFPAQRDAPPSGGASTAKTEGGGKESSQHRVHRHRSVSWPLYALRQAAVARPRFVTRSRTPKERSGETVAHRLKSGVRA